MRYARPMTQKVIFRLFDTLESSYLSPLLIIALMLAAVAGLFWAVK